MAEIGAELLFQVIAERAERAAVIVTTNLPFSELLPCDVPDQQVMDVVAELTKIVAWETGRSRARVDDSPSIWLRAKTMRPPCRRAFRVRGGAQRDFLGGTQADGRRSRAVQGQ